MKKMTIALFFVFILNSALAMANIGEGRVMVAPVYRSNKKVIFIQGEAALELYNNLTAPSVDKGQRNIVRTGKNIMCRIDGAPTCQMSMSPAGEISY